MFALAEIRDVHPGGAELVVHLDPAKRPSIYFTGRIVGPDGKAIAGCNLETINSALDWYVHDLAKNNGSFRLGPFPPGHWGFGAEHEDCASFLAKERDLAADEVWDLGTVQLSKGDPIEIELIYPEEAQHYPPSIEVYALDSDISEWCKVDGDHGRTPPLAPGRYELRLSGAYAAFRQTTDVIAGRANKVTLILKPGITLAIRLTGADTSARTSIAIIDAAGKIVMENGPYLRKAEPFQFSYCLAPGHYQLVASDTNGRRQTLEFDVDSSTAQKTIEINLH